MAKKRKEPSEEEEFDFKLPKFDEQKFLKRERRNIKTLFISFLFGLLIAIISFGFWALLKGNPLRWELILLIGVFNASWIKYLFVKLKIDLTDFGRKGWFTSFAIYFFTWVIILILFCNPPFYDDQAPQVSVVSLPGMQEAGGSVKIVAHIADNSGMVEKNNIHFSLIYPDGTNTSPDFLYEDNIFLYTYDNTNNLMGNYQFLLTAQDNSGLLTEQEGTFTYDNDTILLPDPVGATVSPGPAVTYASTIKFDVEPNVSRVYYQINDGREINASIQGDFYESYPKFVGWEKNTNVTMTAYAEVIHYFVNVNHQFNNTIVDSTPYYFQVGSEKIGEESSPAVELPHYQPVTVPGFEAVVFVFALVIAVVLLKRKKKDNEI
ncbi:MAG: hypothetical protein V1726_08720 [Methanobacteriota archaeon]